MTTLTLTLVPITAAWLSRVAGPTDPAAVVVELLRELADPDNVDGDLIDRLLAEAAGSFPPVMTLDEQDEKRAEVLDGLCHRLVETYRTMLGEPMSLADRAAFRERLIAHAKHIWD